MSTSFQMNSTKSSGDFGMPRLHSFDGFSTHHEPKCFYCAAEPHNTPLALRRLNTLTRLAPFCCNGCSRMLLRET